MVRKSEPPSLAKPLDEFIFLLYGTTGLVDTNRTRLFKLLCLFQRTIKPHQQAYVTQAAIRGWFFKKPPARPKREAPLRFLASFLDWIVTQPGASDKKLDRQEVLSLQTSILEILPKEEPESSALARLPKAPAVKAGISRNPWTDEETLEKFIAVEGSYQVIRPYTSRSDQFIVEALSVEVNRSSREVHCLMYSHNRRQKYYLYSGDIFTSSRYCFSLIRRRHEDYADRDAIRSVALYVAHEKQESGYAERPCLSGIMIRGVSGEAIATRVVGLPFILIRGPRRANNLRTPDFTHLAGDIHRLNPSSHILVGVVKQSDGQLYDFCKTVFDKLRPELIDSSNMVINSVPPRIVEGSISIYAKSADHFFSQWSIVIDKLVSDK